MFQSLGLLLIKRPRVVFSKGGYVSLPMNVAAFITRTPLILHESDSRMGLANRLSARLATHICLAFPNLKKQYPKATITGNPTRED
ncbi:glycosyltransferase [Candidatus Peregrinibacteria bacterium]|nr:MAG: glycosyltransferase [Candidatus Peregrinibacteria bacterium]